jgi:hypothetical protein
MEMNVVVSCVVVSAAVAVWNVEKWGMMDCLGGCVVSVGGSRYHYFFIIVYFMTILTRNDHKKRKYNSPLCRQNVSFPTSDKLITRQPSTYQHGRRSQPPRGSIPLHRTTHYDTNIVFLPVPSIFFFATAVVNISLA